MIVWDIEIGEAANIIDCHPDIIYSMSLNRDGSLLATTCKDKKLRIIEPRSGLVKSVSWNHTPCAEKYMCCVCFRKVFVTLVQRPVKWPSSTLIVYWQRVFQDIPIDSTPYGTKMTYLMPYWQILLTVHLELCFLFLIMIRISFTLPVKGMETSDITRLLTNIRTFIFWVNFFLGNHK